MPVKKFLKGLCIFYAMFYYQSLFAKVDSCIFKTYSDGIEIANIGNRQIYTLFTAHLDNERNEVLTAFNNRSNYTLSQFISHLNRIIDRHQTTIKSEQSDVQKVTRLVQSEEISWIGVEGSPEEIEGSNSNFGKMVSNYLELQPAFNEQSSTNLDLNKTDQILYLMFNAIIIAYANHSEVFDRIPIVPLEDNDLRREVRRILHEIKQMQSHLPIFILSRAISPSQFSELHSIFTNSRYISNQEFETLLDLLETQEIEEDQTSINGIPIPKQAKQRHLRTLPTHVQAEFKMFLRTFTDKHNILHGDLYKKRDQKAVQSILDHPGNGLVLFGTNHGPGIKEGLTTACKNNL